MQKIHVQRLVGDPRLAGVIEPEDRSWKLVVDKDGVPHLWLRVRLEDSDDGKAQHGYLNVEDMLPDGGLCFADLMKGQFGGQLSPEEEAQAFEEHMARLEARGGCHAPPKPLLPNAGGATLRACVALANGGYPRLQTTKRAPARRSSAAGAAPTRAHTTTADGAWWLPQVMQAVTRPPLRWRG